MDYCTKYPDDVAGWKLQAEEHYLTIGKAQGLSCICHYKMDDDLDTSSSDTQSEEAIVGLDIEIIIIIILGVVISMYILYCIYRYY